MSLEIQIKPTSLDNNYNPDVLTCLANLSNDEVFTPPSLANSMLDQLPNELWSNPDAKFLDPVSKSGVFLREIAKRLMVGLESSIPDLQERINHIYTQQLYGISITELTALLSRRSLYCSKYANSKYSIVSNFNSEVGNITFERTEHKWFNDHCVFCGASQSEYDRSEELETHAYKFIHTNKPEELYNMQFDVIIGNPPYQLNDGGGTGSSAVPLYDKFVIQAKKLNPRYLTMIIPSRWFVGGKGLDSFRDNMLNDNRIRVIHDYFDASHVFPGVSIKGGVNYFLWDRDNSGDVEVFNHEKDTIKSVSSRKLLEQDLGSFIRFNDAISIFHKVGYMEDNFSSIVSVRRPFGLSSTFRNYTKIANGKPKLYANKTVAYITDDNLIATNRSAINKYKVLISFGYGAGESFPHQIINKPFIAGPNTVCTETYLMVGPFEDEFTAKNVMSYMSTRFFRFLVMLKKNTQNGTKHVYQMVPMQDFTQKWTDEKLYNKYSINEEEIEFIESMIRPMELK
jgi:site-specific DNA-methyltransferase (adenine-specific)